MPEYRVEIAPSARAMCQDTVCKQEKVKIPKGELRFGTWAEPVPDRGSWRWKHWGCVSGLQMLQANELCDQNQDGELAFDFLDGYDDLVDHPDLQEKIRRCVTQAHIDPEDFKGDPEFNVPGQRGIRAPARKGKKADENASDDDAASKTKAPAKKGKRAQKKADDSEAEDVKPAKKGKRSQKQAEESGAEDAKPTKKASKRKADAKDGGDDEDSKPAKKTKKSAKKVKDESDDEHDAEDQKPAKGAKSKVTKKGASSTAKAKPRKRTKSSPAPEDVKSESETGSGDEKEEPAPAAKKKASRGKAAKPAKAEPYAGRRRSQRMSAKE